MPSYRDYKHLEIALSILNNDKEKLLQLLKNGENNIYKEYGREQTNEMGEHLLIKACRLNKMDCFEILLQEYEKDYELAKRLVTTDDDVNLLKYIFVAFNDQVEKVKEFLKFTKQNVENILLPQALIILKHKIPTENNECVRITITNDNKKFLFELLLNGLTNLNTIIDLETGDTPGTYIIKQGRLDLLKRMINIGYDLNLQRNVPTVYDMKRTKLILEETLSSSDNNEIVEFILNNTKFTKNIEELLMFTAKNSNIEIFEMVLNFIIKKKFEGNNLTELNNDDQRMVNIKSILDHNRTFFHEIINSKNHILLNYLIKYDFDYQFKNVNDQTPLHLAVSNKNNLTFIKELLKRGQDVTINFNDGESVSDNLTMDSGKEIVTEIMKYFSQDCLAKHFSECIELIIIGFQYDVECLSKYVQHLDSSVIYDDELNLSFIYSNEKFFDYLKVQGNERLLGRTAVVGDTTLILAIKYGTKNMVKYILENSPSSLVNIANKHNWTPLSTVIYRGNEFLDIFDELIKLGGDPFIIDNKKNSLLHHAVLEELEENYVKRLLDLGLDPNLQDNKQSTPLHLSTKIGRTPNIFKLLLETGKCNIEIKNYRGNTILHNVSKAFFPHFCEVLFDLTKPDLFARNNIKQTALHLCFDIHRYRKLIENGAEINPLDELNFPPYMHFAYEWSCDLLMDLFKNNDNLDYTMVATNNMTLLSCLPESIQISDYTMNEHVLNMFRKTTNIITPHDNQTAVFKAARHNLDRLKLMFELSETEIDINHRDINNETALFQSFDSWYLFDDTFEKTKYLISKGYDVNVINNVGETILFRTRSSKQMKIALENGAHVNVKNHKNETPLQKACNIDNLEQIFLLLCYGGDLNSVETICTDEFTKDLIKTFF